MTRFYVRWLAASLLCASSAAAQSLEFEGPEFAVNTYTTGAQDAPEVACASTGACVAIWSSSGQDGSGSGVFARQYDASGSALGPEQLVNGTTAGDQSEPALCIDGAGAFVAAWTGAGTGDSSGVFARMYDSAGAPLAPEFLVNTYTTGDQLHASIACHDDGSFVVTWTGVGTPPGQDGAGSGVYAQRFDSAGGPAGGEFLVNSVTTAYQAAGAVSASPDGGFVVAWDEYGPSLPADTNGDAIRARRYDALGAPLGTQFTVASRVFNSVTADSWTIKPDVSHDEGGNHVFVWTSGFVMCEPPFGCITDPGSVHAKAYDSSGAAIGSTPVTSAWNLLGASVAARDGGFAVTWDSYAATSVFARSFDAQPQPASATTVINQSTTGLRSMPEIAAAGEDRYLVVWAADGQDGDSLGIFGRYLCNNADGDAACDSDDPCPNDPLDDADADGLCADVDNCPAISNSGQEDADGDSVGDPCDACPGFDDLADADDDGAPDDCDLCPQDPDNDADGDGICGDVDNCPGVANSGQADADGDFVGDPCDLCPDGDDYSDTDSDGVPDACDACNNPFGSSNFQTSRVKFKKINADPLAANDGFKLTGIAAPQSLEPRPDLEGGRLIVANAIGVTLIDAVLPAGNYGGGGTAGWSLKRDTWTFRDTTGAPTAGIFQLRMKGNGTSEASFLIKGRNATYPITAGDEPVSVSVELGDSHASEGVCAETHYSAGECAFNGPATVLTCKH